MLQHAFKEWAVICRALGEGRQALILRKGGIAEDGGEFAVRHNRFWLYPTYTHQQRGGIQEEARPLLAAVEKDRPPPGVVRLSHFAEVAGIYHVKAIAPALLLAHLHIWSDDVVRKRFAYRTPGLYVLVVRVWKAATVTELTEGPEQVGCRSWVELDRPLPTDGATPVLGEESVRQVHQSLDLLLNPTALC
jgi:hypothetical protein